MTYVLTGKIGYRKAWLTSSHIIRVELRDNIYKSLDETYWRDASADDLNALILAAHFKPRPQTARQEGGT